MVFLIVSLLKILAVFSAFSSVERESSSKITFEEIPLAQAISAIILASEIDPAVWPPEKIKQACGLFLKSLIATSTLLAISRLGVVSSNGAVPNTIMAVSQLFISLG